MTKSVVREQLLPWDRMYQHNYPNIWVAFATSMPWENQFDHLDQPRLYRLIDNQEHIFRRFRGTNAQVAIEYRTDISLIITCYFGSERASPIDSGTRISQGRRKSKIFWWQIMITQTCIYVMRIMSRTDTSANSHLKTVLRGKFGTCKGSVELGESYDSGVAYWWQQ